MPPRKPETRSKPIPSEANRNTAYKRIRLDAVDAVLDFGARTSRSFVDAHELLIHAGLIALGHEGIPGKPDPWAYPIPPRKAPPPDDLAKT